MVRDVCFTLSYSGRCRLHILHPRYLRASRTSFTPRDSHSDPPGRRLHEPSESQICRGRTPAFMRRRPRWVARCSVHAPLSKPPQPGPDANGAGVPERKIGSEALEASAKLRKSSIDCLSAASFEAARSEQLRLLAEGPLKRRDGSSCKCTLNPCQEWSSHLTQPHPSHYSLRKGGHT